MSQIPPLSVLYSTVVQLPDAKRGLKSRFSVSHLHIGEEERQHHSSDGQLMSYNTDFVPLPFLAYFRWNFRAS